MNGLCPCSWLPLRGKYRDTDRCTSEGECTRGIQPDGRIASSFTGKTLIQLMVALHAEQIKVARSLTSHEIRGIRAVVRLTEHTVTGSPDKGLHFRHAICQSKEGAAQAKVQNVVVRLVFTDGNATVRGLPEGYLDRCSYARALVTASSARHSKACVLSELQNVLPMFCIRFQECKTAQDAAAQLSVRCQGLLAAARTEASILTVRRAGLQAM